jgi:hypothetical protein
LHELAPFLRLVLCLYGVFDKEFAAFALFVFDFSFIDRSSGFLDGAFCWLNSADFLPLPA